MQGNALELGAETTESRESACGEAPLLVHRSASARPRSIGVAPPGAPREPTEACHRVTSLERAEATGNPCRQPGSHKCVGVLRGQVVVRSDQRRSFSALLPVLQEPE